MLLNSNLTSLSFDRLCSKHSISNEYFNNGLLQLQPDLITLEEYISLVNVQFLLQKSAYTVSLDCESALIKVEAADIDQ